MAHPHDTASSSASTWSFSFKRGLQNDPFAFAHGLTGVDQVGNFLWVNVGLGVLLTVMALTLCLNIAHRLQAHARHCSAISCPDRQAFWSYNQTQYWPWLKKHVFYAPFWKQRHNAEIQISTAVSIGTLPGRFDIIILVLYFASNLAYMLALPWHDSDHRVIYASLRGRAGSLATFNLIPMILFALRNNPLIPLLRVSYDTFNLLHRWFARLVIVEALIHTAAWMVNAVDAGGMKVVSEKINSTPSYRWGTVSTVLFMFMFIQAWSPLRHAFYETFLSIHRLSALFAFIGVYCHLDLHHLPQIPWMKIVVVLWGLEWLVRSLRIVYFNLSARFQMSTITVEALPMEASRVTIQLVRPWAPRPGCHVHIYMPMISLWSSHPFSIAWANAPRHALPQGKELPFTELDLDNASKQPTTKSISLIIRAREGFTRQLHNKAKANGGKFTTWGAMEGPYGGHDKLNSYGTVVLFAGGVGITHQVNYVRDLVQGYAEGTVAARKVLLVWSVPNKDCLEWVKPWMDQILQLPHRRDVLRIMLFITKPTSRVEFSSSSDTVKMFPGRPPIQSIIDKEIIDRQGAVAITVCGPGAFADGVRVAARKRVDVGAVDFIEEAFTY
jgi:predicted ferric reductase